MQKFLGPMQINQGVGLFGQQNFLGMNKLAANVSARGNSNLDKSQQSSLVSGTSNISENLKQER